jgi:hypothetical protein
MQRFIPILPFDSLSFNCVSFIAKKYFAGALIITTEFYGQPFKLAP